MRTKIDRRCLSTGVALLLAAASTFAAAQVPKSTLNTNTATSFPDNTVGAITPAILRTYFGSIINSFQQYAGVRPVVASLDTIGLSDYGQLVTYNNASPVAVTLPAANGSFATFNVYISNLGAGAVTITPQGSSLINGSATLVLSTSQSSQIISDGTNWQLFKGFGTGTLNSASLVMPGCFSVSGSPITGTSGTFTVTTNGTQGGIPWFNSATNCGSSAALTQFGLMVGGGTGGAPSAIAAGTNGQVPIGQTGANPVMTTLSGDVASVSAGGALVNGKVNGVSQPSSGTQGGIKWFNSTASEVSSALLTANAFMIGGGTGAAPSTVAITGLVLGNGASVPTAYGGTSCTNQFIRALSTLGVATCNSVSLSADVTGTLGISNGGTGQTTAVAARQSSGLNIWGDAGTAHGDTGVTIGNTERFAYTSAAFTASRAWVLPAANVTGQPYSVQISDMFGGVTGTNTLVITRAGSDSINGGTTATISAAFGGYNCYSDGSSKWSCLSMGPASAGGVSSVTCFGVSITTSGTCTIAATKSDEQTGTSTTAVVTPSQQQQHDSSVKAWVEFTGSTGATLAAYNVSSVTRTAAGAYTVNFTTSFATANYACSITSNATGGTGLFGFIQTNSASNVTIQYLSSAFAATDPFQGHVICLGRQ